MENKIEILNDILSKTCKTDKQYEFALKILREIIEEQIMINSKLKKLTEKQYKDYFKTINKLTKLVQIFGLTEVDFLVMSEGFLDFVLECKKELKKEITCRQLTNFRSLYINYCSYNGFNPSNLNDLKKFEHDIRK